MADEREEQQDAGQTQGDQTEDATGGQPAQDGGEDRIEFDAEQQARIDRLIKERLTRERQKWEQKLEAERKDAERKAEEERLKEQEEFKALAEKREARIAELETQIAERETQMQEQRVRFAVQAAAAQAGVDFKLAWRVIDHAELEFDDDGQPTNVEQLLKKAIEDFGLTTKAEQSGVPPSPRARGSGQLTDEERRRHAYFPRL